MSLRVPRSRLQKVLYGPERVKCIVKGLRSVLDLLKPLVKVSNPLINEKIAEAFWGSIEGIRYLYKSEAYKYENECRFVVAESDIQDNNKICFEYQNRNNSPTRIRHYYKHEELEIKNLLTTGSIITLGPCVPYPYNMGYYLKELLKRANLGGPEIKTSKIPYRKS